MVGLDLCPCFHLFSTLLVSESDGDVLSFVVEVWVVDGDWFPAGRVEELDVAQSENLGFAPFAHVEILAAATREEEGGAR